MQNWKTPRPLINPNEVERRKRPNQLYAPHVEQLNKFVLRIQESKYGDESVPWFDPAGAGINAKALLLLQDPSDVAAKGTGFISPDNPDPTADNTTYFRNRTNLRPDELIHWNIVPWKIGNRKPVEEIRKARPILIEFLKLLPKLKVVVCMGKLAADGWNQCFPDNACKPGWKLCSDDFVQNTLLALECPHPSWQGAYGNHPLVDGFTSAERIEITLSNVRQFLNNNS